MYNELVEEYFFNPRHVGTLELNEPNGVSRRLRNKAHGVQLVLSMKCNEQGLVQRACFQAVGDPYAVAALECLCRRAQGSVLEALAPMDYRELVDVLGVSPLQYPTLIQVQSLYNEVLLLMKKLFRG